MINSSWAAARTCRQLPQLSSFTVTCNGMAKRWSMGALHNPEPFKVNRPLGMSLSPRVRARDRSKRDNHVAPLCFSRAGWVCPPQTSALGSQGKGAMAAGGVVTAPRVRSLCPLICPLHPLPMLPAAKPSLLCLSVSLYKNIPSPALGQPPPVPMQPG